MITPAAAENMQDAADVRLAICSAGELFGGVERHILEFCRWWISQGRAPLLVLFHDRELAAQARQLGMAPVILGSGHVAYPRAVGDLGRLLKDQDIQVVHAHGYLAVVSCALARKKRSIPMVRTVHGMIEPTPRPSLKGLKSKVYTRLEQQLGRRANAAVTYVSEDLRQRHESIDRGLVTRTVHNGIHPLDRSEYQTPENWDPSLAHLVSVGRLTGVKGLDYLLEALPGLKTERDFRVHILGTGPAGEDLEKTSRELGLSDRVLFHGFRRDVHSYLAHADALVMPSLHEGLPYTVLEAMSLRVPILAAKVGGMAEILTEGETALLFPARDPVLIREAIFTALTDPDRMDRVRQQAHQDFLRRFQIDSMAGNYLNLYQSLLQGSPA